MPITRSEFERSMTQEQELNEKLAEWAGFALVDWEKQVCGTAQPWISLRYPDNTYHDRNNMPNFTQSLDDCFKWLVPKLRSGASAYSRAITLYQCRTKWGCYLSEDKGRYSVAETPALALCLAIEKLIEGGKSGT